MNKLLLQFIVFFKSGFYKAPIMCYLRASFYIFFIYTDQIEAIVITVLSRYFISVWVFILNAIHMRTDD